MLQKWIHEETQIRNVKYQLKQHTHMSVNMHDHTIYLILQFPTSISLKALTNVNMTSWHIKITPYHHVSMCKHLNWVNLASMYLRLMQKVIWSDVERSKQHPEPPGANLTIEHAALWWLIALILTVCSNITAQASNWYLSHIIIYHHSLTVAGIRV